MRKRRFFRLGQFVYRFRVAIVLVWIGIIIGCLPFIGNITAPFQQTGFSADNSESVTTKQYLDDKLGYHSNRFIILYKSKHLRATSPAYIKQLKKSLSGLKNFPKKHEIIFPDANSRQISKDKHTAYVVILFKDNSEMAPKLFRKFKSAIKKPPKMTMLLGGERSFDADVNLQTQKDIYKADIIASPVSVVIMILVFGTIVAALVPIVLGGGCALIILTTLYFLGHAFTLSIFTLNIALLLGLCLSLDYSLFIIYRFREEMQKKKSIRQAIATTQAKAGKAVFFSGLTVFISLSALLLFPINVLFSVGVGGLVAVGFAVAIAITFLPAVLAILNHRVNWWSVRFSHKKETNEAISSAGGFWYSIANTVVKRPLLFFFGTLIGLLLLGYPFLNARLGISDFLILPPHTESRQFFDLYNEKFNPNELTPIFVVVTAKKGRILSKSNLSKVYNFTNKLKKNPLIEQVNSIVTTKPRLTKSQYARLYNSSRSRLSSELKQLLKTTTTKHLTVISIVSKYNSTAPETKDLVEQLRKVNPGKELTLHLAGVPVNNADVLDSILALFPYALAWIIVLTYLVLLVLLRSLFLPLKAILMNILSLCASYGVLVFVFQEGHFHQLLNFTPQGMLDISLLVIVFCALFGFSMDYEVFLLTRIQEYYAQSRSNDKSVIFGIVKSSRIITSAAVIVIVLCGSFMVADVLMVKAFGLGIAVAIFVDAFIIRTLLVPATMVLVKKWNWYLPKWMDRILPK